MKERRTTQILISLTALILAAIHIFLPGVQIDSITTVLFMISILPWLGSLFKSVEIPGGIKIEYAEIKKIAEEAQAAGMLNEETSTSVTRKKYTFETVINTDLRLALAGLRIELESALNKLASHNNISLRENRGIKQITTELCKKQIISLREQSVIADLIPMLNSAVHGAEIDNTSLDWAFNIGVNVLHSLEEKIN